ncbi:MAG TPA: hypothetical protein VH637_15490 [Streptosporangiaceae bacterium]|jgi:hypothetical protein
MLNEEVSIEVFHPFRAVPFQLPERFPGQRRAEMGIIFTTCEFIICVAWIAVRQGRLPSGSGALGRIGPGTRGDRGKALANAVPGELTDNTKTLLTCGIAAGAVFGEAAVKRYGHDVSLASPDAAYNPFELSTDEEYAA